MLFEEKQRLKLWWLYILLAIETVMIASLLLANLSWQEMKDSYFAPIWAILIPYPIVYVVNRTALTLQIDQMGIAYHYQPFSKRKFISWNDIEEAYLRKYDALGEYGGWGAKSRLWFKLNDKAYIFNDQTVGLQLILVNGKKILFSTGRKEELNLLLINIKQQYQIKAIDTDVRER